MWDLDSVRILRISKWSPSFPFKRLQDPYGYCKICFVNGIEFARVVSDRVSAEMQHQGVTQVALSQETGIPQVTISRSLAGHRPFSVTELKDIANALGRTFSDFADDVHLDSADQLATAGRAS